MCATCYFQGQEHNHCNQVENPSLTYCGVDNGPNTSCRCAKLAYNEFPDELAYSEMTGVGPQSDLNSDGLSSADSGLVEVALGDIEGGITGVYDQVEQGNTGVDDRVPSDYFEGDIGLPTD